MEEEGERGEDKGVNPIALFVAAPLHHCKCFAPPRAPDPTSVTATAHSRFCPTLPPVSLFFQWQFFRLFCRVILPSRHLVGELLQVHRALACDPKTHSTAVMTRLVLNDFAPPPHVTEDDPETDIHLQCEVMGCWKGFFFVGQSTPGSKNGPISEIIVIGLSKNRIEC